VAYFADCNFDSNTFDFWKRSSAGENLNHIKIEKDAGGSYLRIEGGSGDASVWQDLNVSPGKNYTASIWVRIGGDDNGSARKTKLVIKDMDGNVLAENFVVRNTIPLYITEHYFESKGDKSGDTTGGVGIPQWIHPMKAQFTAPANGKIRYILETEATDDEDASVYLTWASCKEFFTEIDYKLNDASIPFREDFENADERWGGLICAHYSQNSQTHLAEKIEEGKEWYVPKDGANVMGLEFDVPEQGLQPFNYIINGKYTLVSHEGVKGELLRTLPQNMRLEANKKYKISFNYKVYSDKKVEDSKKADALYAVEVKGRINASDYKTLLYSELENTPKEFDRSVADYMMQKNEPAFKSVEFIVDTGMYCSMDDPMDGDIYLVFVKLAGGSEVNLFLDDIIVCEI
jgi:endo-alpha-N-acetylgalactosaminidase